MNRNPLDPVESLAKLFGDTARPDKGESALFSDAGVGRDPRSRLHASIVRLRILRGQAGSDGLTPAATRSLLDEVLKALEAVAEAMPADTEGKSDAR